MENGSVVQDPASDLLDDAVCHCHEASPGPQRDPVLPAYKPSCSSTPNCCSGSSPQRSYSDLDPDSHSWTSQDSGIPTLEIQPPEPVLHAHRQHSGDAAGLGHDSPATLPLDDDPANNTVRKSSTFPRSGYDSVRLFGPAVRLPAGTGMGVRGGALNRSDDISVCSVSSMSTELSASNEDGLDFTVTSDSSAIVTLETDHAGATHFSDVMLASPGSPRDPWSPTRPHPGSGHPQQDDGGRQKKAGPLASLFNR